MAGQSQRVREVVAPVAQAAGYDLEDVTITSAGRRSVVRVVVDTDGGVDLDHVADLSRSMSDLLDGTDALGSTPYVLEVTSPGVDRPLSQPRHWRRAVGRLVTTEYDGATVTGRVVSSDDASVTLDVDGGKRALPLADISPGRVQIEFNRADGERS